MASGPIVGLDIGSQQIKAVEVRPTKAGFAVTALGIAPTPVGAVQNNMITDPKVMAQALKALFKDNGISTKRVIGSVAGQNTVVVRVIEVPKMTDAELKETMKWEVERHVPFAPSETVMDYQALPMTGPPDEANPNMEVLLAVAQQDVVSNFIDALFTAGLDPAAIDIEPLAAGRALLDIADGKPVVRPPAPTLPSAAPAESEFTGNFGDLDTPQEETAAVINIGASNTDISIFQGGQLVFPRSLPLAGDSLTRAIAELLSYPLDQAERVKRDYGEVQLDRMAVYTGTAYGDAAGYEGPQFQEEEEAPAFFEDTDTQFDVPNPFGTPAAPAEAEANPFGQNPFLTTPETPAPDDLERTQPIARRTLNLARRPDLSGGPLPFMPPGEGDALGFGGTGGGAHETELREQVFEAIAPVLGELATELRRSLDYYRSRAQGRSVDRVLLTGGGALLPHFAQFLQNELQVPVSLADPLFQVTVSAKRYDPAYLQTIAPTFAVAMGLAVRNVVFDANPAPKVPKAPKPPKAKKGAASATGASVP